MLPKAKGPPQMSSQAPLVPQSFSFALFVGDEKYVSSCCSEVSRR